MYFYMSQILIYMYLKHNILVSRLTQQSRQDADLSCVMRKPLSGVSTMSDINQAVKPQTVGREMKFLI